jgi:hypothetical protein
MTKIKNNPIMKGASGMLGKTVVYRESKDGTLIMANKPKKSGIVTDQQLIVMSRFEEASQYAKAQLLDPTSKAEYTAAGISKNRSAYQVAMSDYLKKPKMLECDTAAYTGLVGDIINVRALDDFKITSVQVRITSATGVLIEQGTAVSQALTPHIYRYAATAANATLHGTKVVVTLRDKPGNATVTEKVL